MATITAVPNPHPVVSDVITLASAQTGNGASTNIADRRGMQGSSLLTIVSTVGGSPTVTLAIEGSADGTTWWSIPYCLVATPETIAVANVVITTAVTNRYVLRAGHPWRYVRTFASANTAVTLTTTVHFFRS